MKRFLPVIAAFAVTAFAAGGAATVNFGIGMALALPEGAQLEALDAPAAEPSDGGDPEAVADAGEPAATDTSTQPTPGTAGAPSKPEYINGILARNIFDSAAIGKAGPPVDTGTQVTALDVRLVATIVAVPASYSSALIAPKTDMQAIGTSYSLGHKIKNSDAEIIEIKRKEVTLRRADGTLETLKIVVDEVAVANAPATATPTTGGDEDGQVQQTGENQYVVQRSLLDKYMNNLDDIGRLGRAIPHRGPDGEIDGYRLSGVRRGTVGEKLGIRNGDIVHSVNGQPLTSMQGAMSAFGALQSSSSFTFEITRRGQKQTMSYDVR